jgi:ssDNA thymidine ADP-ribosyltransferase, DarT
MNAPAKENIWVFRMVHYQNVPYILVQGMHCSRSPHKDPGYVRIGSVEVISWRDSVAVKCDPDCVVNDYVPFYFGIRTPMLYKIHTGYGVPRQPQEDIVYLCCRFAELVGSGLTWCFTDGNAATGISDFFTEEDAYRTLDWKSIFATQWNDNNPDGDHDRMRKKHSEFLVKGHVPPSFIRAIVVRTVERHQQVQQWIDGTGLDIKVYSNQPQFYF